jgi:stage V sporulation protein G
MKVTARIYPVFAANRTAVGYGSICLDDCFIVDGVRVMNGKKGLFVSMPSRKNDRGEYDDLAFPLTKELRDEINAVVLRAYYAVTGKNEAGDVATSAGGETV